jgi:hypothetical protein
MNKFYQTLLHSKIEKFKYDFKFSKNIFEDLTKKNKLLHPAEYGIYKEKICDDIIKFVIPSKFKTGTGFIINSNDDISTQCDIIIYDYDNTPLIEDSSNTRFFPVETVVGIGEIKSSLAINDLIDALIKLANNKKIKQINTIYCLNNTTKQNFESKNPHDTLFSFLICDKIQSFNSEIVLKKIDEAYELNNIEYEYRHNVILSMEDGILSYQNQYTTLPKEIPNKQKMYMPRFLEYTFENCYINNEVNRNIIYLFSSLSKFFNKYKYILS